MPETAERGPPVPDHEALYPLITTPDWWLASEQRPSSAAFNHSPYSVNVVSLTTLDETMRQLRVDLGQPDGGVVEFGCGIARGLGFNAHLELDERFPENQSHAHVYYDAGNASRKRNARKLAEGCRVVHEPQFSRP